MAVTYSTAAKTARMASVSTTIGSGGKLEICTSGYGTILATINLDSTAGTASSGVLTLSGFPKTVAASAAGTAAIARIRTSGNVDVVTGLTVGTSGTDIILDNTNIQAGQNVTINASPTITHAA
jgi:hypothetical protein